MLKTAPGGDWLPLTLAQLDFWEEFCFHPDQPVSTVAHCLEIEGDLDAAAFSDAIAQVCREADILSVRFRQFPGQPAPLQRCDPANLPTLRQIDLSNSPQPWAEALALMQADVDARLDLLSQPLSAQWLIRLSSKHWLWYNRGHHIILDGYSMMLLEQRCARLYRQFTGHGDGGAAFLPFADYIDEEATYRASPLFQSDRAFWAAFLQSAPPLPVLQKGGEEYATEGLSGEATLATDLCRNLQLVAQQTGIGWPDLLVLLSAAYLLQEGSDGGPLPVWLPFMSRLGSVSAAIPALVVNILPLHVTGKPGETLGEYLCRMVAVLRCQRRHGRYRVEQIAADHGLGAGSRFFFSPLINVLPFNSMQLPDCTLRSHVLSNGPADGFNLTFRAQSDGSDLSLWLDADPSLTGTDDFRRHCRDLPTFLAYALVPGNLGFPIGKWRIQPDLS